MPDFGDLYDHIDDDVIPDQDMSATGPTYADRVETDQRALEYAQGLIDAIVYPENEEMVRYAAGDASILACILRASGRYIDPNTGLSTWGGGLDWALQACVVRPWADEQPPKDDDSAFDLTEPSWLNSFSRLITVDSPLAATIILALALNVESHDKIMIRLAQALTKEKFA